jgi:radical SAM protein with 4Fe4S-binding SPASM domain
MGSKVIPRRVWLSLTGSCNNACRFCYRAGSERHVSLDYAVASGYIRTLYGCGIRNFTLIGGEPTLHAEHERFVEDILSRNGTTCTLITNGRRLEHVPKQWLASTQLRIVVSLHGASPSHYREVTGSAVGYQETIAGIKRIVGSDVILSMNVVLSKENHPRLDEFLSVAASLRPANLCFTLAINSVDCCDNGVDPHSYPRMIEEVHRKCAQRNLRHLFICSIPWCTLGAEFAKELFSARELMFNCPVDRGRGLVINEDGSLSLCTHLSNYPVADAVSTNAILSSEADFVEFWNSASLTGIRSEADVYRHPECLGCIFNMLCKGGCPLWWRDNDLSKVIHRI